MRANEKKQYVPKLTNDTINSVAVTAIQQMCNETEFLKPRLDIHGNFPSWDGDILFCPNGDSKKGMYRIPVQIKGTTKGLTYKDGEYWFTADRVYLEIYQRNGRNTMYLVVAIDSYTGSVRQIGYADLTAIELRQALKQTRKNPHIPIKLMPADSSARLQIFKNYLGAWSLLESAQIIDLSAINENANISSLSFIPTREVRFTGDFSDLIGQNIRITTRTADGDTRAHHVPVQVKKASGDFDVCFDFGNGMMFFIGPAPREVNERVSVSDDIYYDNFNSIKSGNNISLVIGGFFTIRFVHSPEEGLIRGLNLSVALNNINILEDRIRAIKFTIVAYEIGSVEIGRQKIQFDPINEQVKSHLEQCKSELVDLLNIEKLFLLLNISTQIDISSFTDYENRLICNLITTLVLERTLRVKERYEHTFTLYTPILREHRLALIIVREENPSEPIKIMQLVDHNKPRMGAARLIDDGNSKYLHPVPVYSVLDPTMLAEFSNIDFNDVYKEFAEIPHDDILRDGLRQEFILEGLKSYDNGGLRKDELLETIIKLLQDETSKEGDIEIAHKINLLQAYKRKRELTKDERNTLLELSDTESSLNQVAVYLILDNLEHALYLYNKLSTSDKEIFDTWPESFFMKQ